MKKIVFISILTVILAIFGLLGFKLSLVFAYIWVEPGCQPPGCNVNPPIDTSVIDQEKEGGLRVKGGQPGVGAGFSVGYDAEYFHIAPDGTLTLQNAVANFHGGLISTVISGSAIIGETTGSAQNDIGIKGVAPATAWAGWFQGTLGVDGSAAIGAPGNGYLVVGGTDNQGYNSAGDAYFYDDIGLVDDLTVGQSDDTISSSLVLWARGQDHEPGLYRDIEFTISGTGNYSGQLNISVNEIALADFPYGKIVFLNSSSVNSWDLNEFTVQADDIYLGGDTSDVVYITGNVEVGNPTPVGVPQTGDLNAQRLCLDGDCISDWSEVGGPGSGISYPTEIRETYSAIPPYGLHNAAFGGVGENGWLALKTWALGADNGCETDWHVCQAWELAYIYTEGISTQNCDTDTGYTGDGPDICMGWVVGPVSELGSAGDCYGYTDALAGNYHSSIWYIEQWGIATCNSQMPVLCCK